MTETPIAPIPVATVSSREARITILTPDNQITMPSSPYHKTPSDVRITSVTCIWGWTEFSGPTRRFAASGHRKLKDGSDGIFVGVQFGASFEPPEWMTDLVAPYVPDWYQAGGQRS